MVAAFTIARLAAATPQHGLPWSGVAPILPASRSAMIRPDFPGSTVTPAPSGEAARTPVLIDLALQGGGSHGAFTWGVLDRLLEEPWLQIAGISGTSAGAMNAAVLADGWTQ